MSDALKQSIAMAGLAAEPPWEGMPSFQSVHHFVLHEGSKEPYCARCGLRLSDMSMLSELGVIGLQVICLPRPRIVRLLGGAYASIE